MDGKERVGDMMTSSQNPPRTRGGGPRSGGGGYRPQQRPEVYSARKQRSDMSLPEVLLWEQLRASRLGFKFRRQHPIGPYIADFFCSTALLVIEIDGEAHNRGSRPARDAARDEYMRDRGYAVLRVAAAEVLNEMEAVLIAIRAAAVSPLHRASTVPLPAGGEDLA